MSNCYCDRLHACINILLLYYYCGFSASILIGLSLLNIQELCDAFATFGGDSINSFISDLLSIDTLAF